VEVEISTDPSRLDVAVIHRYLSQESYWAQGIPRELVQRALDNSLCFGAYVGEEQVGLARVITDRATYAYVSDVFVLEPLQGQGVGKKLMQAVIDHPDLQVIRRIMLHTRDAHTLYAQFGFTAPPNPERIMVRPVVDGYLPPEESAQT
jgi:N-acetylglutamate synthase-like GNAT family acetyltransferase